MAVFAALVVAWLVATSLLFVWPGEDSPAHANAVVVLSGAHSERLDKGLVLMRRGVAPVLMISNGRQHELRIDGSKSPATIDFYKKGETTPYGTGIIKRDGNNLVLIYDWGGARATSFDNPPAGYWELTLRHGKEVVVDPEDNELKAQRFLRGQPTEGETSVGIG